MTVFEEDRQEIGDAFGPKEVRPGGRRSQSRSRKRAEARRSPDSLRRRRARGWLAAVLVALGLAFVIGYLLPVDKPH